MLGLEMVPRVGQQAGRPGGRLRPWAKCGPPDGHSTFSDKDGPHYTTGRPPRQQTNLQGALLTLRSLLSATRVPPLDCLFVCLLYCSALNSGPHTRQANTAREPQQSYSSAFSAFLSLHRLYHAGVSEYHTGTPRHQENGNLDIGFMWGLYKILCRVNGHV